MKRLTSLIAAFLAAMLFTLPVQAQEFTMGYPLQCTDSTTNPTIAGTHWRTCAQMNAGVAPGTPSYMRLQDGNSLLLADIINSLQVSTGGIGPGANGLTTWSGNLVWNGTIWTSLEYLEAGDAIGATQRGIPALSLGHFYDGANYRRWLGAQMNTDNVASTTRAPWVGSFGMVYQTDSTVWARHAGETADGGTLAATVDASYNFGLDYGWDGSTWSPTSIVTTHADGLALSLNGKNVASFNYLYNGATMDLWPSTANGGAQIGIEEWHPAYDAGNAWIADFKKDIAVVAPTKTAGTAVDETGGGEVGDVVLSSTYVLNDPNWCVIIKNAGGGSADVLSDAIVLVSPSGAAGEWESLTWTACDTLASGGGTCSFCCSNCSHAYVQGEALCGAGDDSTVDAWLTANKN